MGCNNNCGNTCSKCVRQVTAPSFLEDLYEFAIRNGLFEGTVQEFLMFMKGPEGSDVYTWSIKNGFFSGTKEEFFASLHGRGLNYLGEFEGTPEELPETANPGDAYTIGRDMYVWGIFEWVKMPDFKGPQGESGKTPNFSAGSVVTVLPNEPADVQVVRDGESPTGDPQYKINYKIPQGIKGDPGRDADLSLVNLQMATEGTNKNRTRSGIVITGTEFTDLPAEEGLVLGKVVGGSKVSNNKASSGIFLKDNGEIELSGNSNQRADKLYVTFGGDPGVSARFTGRVSGVAAQTENDLVTKSQVDAGLAAKLDKSVSVVGAGGIDVGGSLASGNLSIGVNDTYFNNRYLRRDQDSDNGQYTLSVGKLVTPLAEISDLKLLSVGAGSEDDSVLVLDSEGNVKKKSATTNVNIGIADVEGERKFELSATDSLRFEGEGDASVSFNALTKTVIISTTPGSGSVAGVSSFNGRTGSVESKPGDYTTAQVAESVNLYFSEPRVRGTLLEGLNSNQVAPVTDNDTVLQGIGKLQGQVSQRAIATRSLTVSGVNGRTIVSGGSQNLIADREWTVDLVSTGVTAGTYTKLVVDTYGRVTSGGLAGIGDVELLQTTLDQKANKNELPDLTPYATQTWVENKNYITNGIRLDSGTDISNGSDGRVNKVWFDYNWAGQNTAGSVISFGGFGGSYQNELFANYGDGTVIGVRSYNGDRNVWSTPRFLWHTGNLDPKVTAEGNSVVQRDHNGYIFANYFNMVDGGNDEVPISSMISTSTDGFFRKNSKQAVNQFLGNPANGPTLQSVLDNGRQWYSTDRFPTIKLYSNVVNGGAGLDLGGGEKHYAQIMGEYGSATSGMLILRSINDSGQAGTTVTLHEGKVTIGKNPFTPHPESTLDVGGIIHAGGVTSSAFGLRYSDGGTYQGLRIGPEQVSIEYWNNTTSGDSVMHRFLGAGNSLMTIDNYGRVGANDATADQHLTTLRQLKSRSPRFVSVIPGATGSGGLFELSISGATITLYYEAGNQSLALYFHNNTPYNYHTVEHSIDYVNNLVNGGVSFSAPSSRTTLFVVPNQGNQEFLEYRYTFGSSGEYNLVIKIAGHGAAGLWNIEYYLI